MSKPFEANEDWIKREHGRIPTKGAMAAERASAGLGTMGGDDPFASEAIPPAAAPAKPAPRTAAPVKP